MIRTLNNVDIQLLKIFQTVVKCHGFTAAQSELNMSQSNISSKISTLEQRLGYRLCDRGKAGFRITEKGKEILFSSQTLFTAINTFCHQAQSLTGQLLGDIHLGLQDNISSSPESKIDKIISQFSQHHHHVKLHLYIKASAELEKGIEEGTLDVAIGYYYRPQPNLHYSALFTEELGVFCGQSHPFFTSSMPDLSQLLASDWIHHRFLESETFPISPVHSNAIAYNMEAVAHAVLAGSHIGYMPIHYAQNWVEQGKMKLLCPDQINHSIHQGLITDSGKKHNEATQVFIRDLLRIHQATVE